ncbi:iron complex outermembrane receptor protein [Sphingomonas vulcanisoli]|uniref:Iron complex outermembrane receptor protein n=1 Tax=Sphingomonas vulcanisoli TaxID=1658060 RepID=A0ABX0TNS6_9SPHN|nr:TonB-dependent receptor [Sphingomonas vulcanisoli]NIJ07157.1 iron complex outermembrane receptor protein [Sphingomonas vulcanisoli]
MALAIALIGSAQPSLAEAPAPASTTDSAGVAPPESEIIVTGTRLTGITAAESAAPIKLVGAEAISHVGQPNLNQVLTQLVPSFNAESFGGDAANLTLSAALRGLNPNETLILVNGKRRHGTANLHVLASPFQGGAAPDLDFVTPASIDHIEVLEDGASAQYGSDAIAGVINIILKKKAGGELTGTGGTYYKGDGKTYSSSLNYGFTTDRGYLNLTGFYRYHGFSQRGGQDIRVLDPVTNTVPATGALASDYQALKNYPNVNPILGDSRSRFAVGSFNAGFDATDGLSFYTFGTVGHRQAESYENIRLPNRLVRTAVLGVDPGTVSSAVYNATVAANPSYIFSRSGFRPQEAIRELDYQATGGATGNVGALHWDLSSTYGADQDKVHTLNSANRDLFINTGTTPTNFYDGRFEATEWTSDLDLTYKLDGIGTLAAGAEYRRNSYTIGAGDPSSYYGTGAQSFPGYSPSSAGAHYRHNEAVYGDFSLGAVDNLKLDAAVRYEDYSDFGGKTTWKVTGRYDFTPAIAIRGTASTGFRAPTLAEEYYTQVNVSPTSAFVQIAANSAAAKVLGIQNLKPEKSTNYSIGTVLRPVSHITLTVDAYQIRIRDRIVGSGEVDTQSTSFNPADLVWQSIIRSGYNVESLNSIGVEAFVNGPTTRTRGVDVVGSYDADFGGAGHAVFTLSGAYNKTKITKQGVVPATLTAFNPNLTLFDAQLTSFLTTAQPKLKLIGGVNWKMGPFSVIARETYYARTHAILNDGGGTYTPTHVSAAGITDLEVDYDLTKRITVAGGANNLFNKKPGTEPYIGGETAGGGVIYNAPLTYTPWGINGGYWYARLTVKL